MTTVIIDRVAVHGDAGTLIVTQGRDGTYYVEARTMKGDRICLPLHRDAVTGEDGLLDQLLRFTGASGLTVVPDPEPEPPTFAEMLDARMREKRLTPVDVGYAVRVRSTSSVDNWRVGHCLPSRKYLKPLAEILDLPFETVMAAYGRAVVANARKRVAA